MDKSELAKEASCIIQGMLQGKMEYVTKNDDVKLPMEVLNSRIAQIESKKLLRIQKEAIEFVNIVNNSVGRINFSPKMGLYNLYPFIKDMTYNLMDGDKKLLSDGKGYVYYIEDPPEEQNLTAKMRRARKRAEDRPRENAAEVNARFREVNIFQALTELGDGGN